MFALQRLGSSLPTARVGAWVAPPLLRSHRPAARPSGGPFSLASALLGMVATGCASDDPPATTTFLSADSYRQVSASRSLTCGVLLDGEVVCWGVDDEGVEAATPDGEFDTVSAGYGGACAQRSAGTVACWDGSGSGEVALWDEAVQISTGQSYENPAILCVLYSSGTIGCWGDCGGDACDTPDGDWSSIQLGHDGGCALGDSGVACWEWSTEGEEPAGAPLQLTVGAGWACGVTDERNAIQCWGSGSQRPADEILAPSGRTFISIDAGHGTLCAVLDDSSVACWGWAAGEPGDYLWPPSGSFTSVSVGEDHVCALRTDGIVECWGGYNLDEGQVVPP